MKLVTYCPDGHENNIDVHEGNRIVIVCKECDKSYLVFFVIRNTPFAFVDSDSVWVKE